MDPNRVAEAASLLTAMRQQHSRLSQLPNTSRPQSVAEAHAIQDAVTALLGVEVRAFKANASGRPAAAAQSAEGRGTQANMPWLTAEGVRAPIYGPTAFPSPARIPATAMPQRGVEGEVAFRFRRDLVPRGSPYGREEVAAAVDACAAIEVVSSRFSDPDATTFLERLADCVSNAGFVYGQAVEGWHSLDFAHLKVELAVNGEPVLKQGGGHPTGDPLGIVVALVEMMRTSTGVKAGQFVTCGSYTGLRYLAPGDRCAVRFGGLGTAEVEFYREG